MKKNDDFSKALEEFKNSAASEMPKLSEEFLRASQRKISAEIASLRLKSSLICIGAGVLTLGFCPQFGLGPFWLAHHGLMQFFMPYGPVACTAFCGFFFAGISSLSLSLAFGLRHRKLMAQFHRKLSLILGPAALAVFMLLAAVMNTEASYGEAPGTLVWLVVATLTAFLFNEIGQKLRSLNARNPALS